MSGPGTVQYKAPTSFQPAFMSKRPGSVYTILRLLAFLSRIRIFNIIGILLLSLLSSAAQFVYLLSFFPLISVLTRSPINSSPTLDVIISIFAPSSLFSHSKELAYLTLFLCFLFLSSFLRIAEVMFGLRLSATIGHDISTRLYCTLLSRSYLAISSTNTSYTLNSLTEDLDYVALALTESSIFIISLFTSIGILTALLSISFYPTFALFAFLTISYLLISKQTKYLVLNNSLIIQELNTTRIKLIQESLASIRDIKIGKLLPFFSHQYAICDYRLRSTRASSELFSSLPRLCLETLVMILLVSISIYYYVRANNTFLLPFIGTFVLGCQKLLPSLNLMYSSSTSLRRFNAPLQNIIKILGNSDESSLAQTSSLTQSSTCLQNFHSLVFRDVSYRYPNSDRFVLSRVSLSITPGQVVLINGPSGSGKSTLVDLIMGLLEPTSGEISYFTSSFLSTIDCCDVDEWQSYLSHVPQTVFLSDISVVANIAFGSDESEVDYELIIQTLRIVRLYDYICSLPNGINTIVGERGASMSGGQIQRLGIARALYQQKPVLVLDEATSGLDTETESALLNDICNLENHPTIIMISHRPKVDFFVDTFITIREGIAVLSHT